MSSKPLIGIVDDERNIQATLAAILERRGYASASAFTGKQGLQMISEQKPDVLLLDLGLPDGEGLDLLRQIRAQHSALPIIVVTANDSLNNAIASIKEGAFHFIAKPFKVEEILVTIDRALENKQQKEENNSLRMALATISGAASPIFRSQAMQQVVRTVERIAAADVTVLRASAAAAALLYPGFLLAPGAAAKLVILAVLSAATAPWYPILQARLYGSLPGRSSVAVTLSSAAGLAGGLGPLAVGLIAEAFGLSWALAVLVVVPVAVLAGSAGAGGSAG